MRRNRKQSRLLLGGLGTDWEEALPGALAMFWISREYWLHNLFATHPFYLFPFTRTCLRRFCYLQAKANQGAPRPGMALLKSCPARVLEGGHRRQPVNLTKQQAFDRLFGRMKTTKAIYYSQLYWGNQMPQISSLYFAKSLRSRGFVDPVKLK